MPNEQQPTFQYSFSARDQEELKKIRSKYLPPEEDKMAKLRRLDAETTRRATMVSLIVGILGALVLGLGMSCCMVWAGDWFVPGIIIGLIGIALAALAYPIYQRIWKKDQARLAPEILRLTDELMK